MRELLRRFSVRSNSSTILLWPQPPRHVMCRCDWYLIVSPVPSPCLPAHLLFQTETVLVPDLYEHLLVFLDTVQTLRLSNYWANYTLVFEFIWIYSIRQTDRVNLHILPSVRMWENNIWCCCRRWSWLDVIGEDGSYRRSLYEGLTFSLYLNKFKELVTLLTSGTVELSTISGARTLPLLPAVTCLLWTPLIWVLREVAAASVMPQISHVLALLHILIGPLEGQ